MNDLLLVLLIISILIALPFYLYILIRFVGTAIAKTIKFFREEKII